MPEPHVIATTDGGPTQEREPVTGGDSDDDRTCRICFASGDDEDDAAPLVTLVILLIGGYVFGFVADRALEFTERDMLRTNGKLCLLTAAPSLINYRALGDGLREFSSTIGVLTGDCRWASAREEHWKAVNETWSPNPSSMTTTTTNDTAAEPGWMVYHHPVRRNLTSCGTFWHAETDAAVIANPVIALLLHCARGVALFGLVEAFVGNVHRFYIAVNVTFRLMRPNWLPEPPVPNVYYVQPLLAAFCMDFLTWTRRRLKVNRQNGYLFAPLQVQAALTTTVAAGFAGHVAWVVAGWLIKKGLSQVQDLVVDLDEDGILAISPAKKRDK
ncbi:hypothetical protein C6P46_002322 [Rhodotorula mucilaginosa]|uniref:Uncharacterized protein n=1 Tax=Rhodotorula mucilaginosa TaxID=5537 RepID=A0A9P7B8C3_RHOMI|nr:hypothetical protein C6P46_002322 [Rhodotorula mucilaginosa]